MRPRFLVDSCVYMDLQRAGIDPRQRLHLWASQGQIYQCGVIRSELLRGLRRPRFTKSQKIGRRNRSGAEMACPQDSPQGGGAGKAPSPPWVGTRLRSRPLPSEQH